MRLPRRELTRIGLDLDNTLIDYSRAYELIAAQLGILLPEVTRDSIRGLLRRSDDDDREWQRFQSVLYTDGLDAARLSEGADEFLRACRVLGISVFVVSHKTQFGPSDFGGRDLRTPAWAWIKANLIAQGLVDPEGVSFCDSLDDKIERISKLGLDAFVDDLLGVIDSPQWPSHTLGVLYSPPHAPSLDIAYVRCFRELTDWIVTGDSERMSH